MPQHRVRPARRAAAGFILLPVVVTLTILAAVAFLMNRETAMGLRMARGDYEADRARYIAEAGLNHTLFKLTDGSCSGTGADLTDEPFDGGTYTTVVTPAGANRVDITATGTLTGGPSRSLTRQGIQLIGARTDTTFQPGPGGKDTYINAQGRNNNYGSSNRVAVDSGGSHDYYALLEFDVSVIPAAAQVRSARLELYLDTFGSTNTSARFTAFRMTTPWVEDAATWNTSDGSSSWSWPGAYDASGPLDETPVDPSFTGWHVWDLTGAVQGWHGGTLLNAGVVIIGSNQVRDAFFFSGDDSDASRWPRLVVTYSCECGQTCLLDRYRDEFTQRVCDEAVDYTGSDGNLDWTPWAWIEEGENSNSCAGGVRVDTDSLAPGGYVLRFENADRSMRREADLTSFTDATLRFDYRRNNLDGYTDALEVTVSADGSGWLLLDQIGGPASDTAYQQASYDVGAYTGGPLHVRLRALGLNGVGNEQIYVDNVEIRDEAGGGGPPLPPPETPVEADAYVDESDRNGNFGTAGTMLVGKSNAGGGKLYHAVLRFDLSSIPPGSTVSSATLRLYQTSASGGPGNLTMHLYHANTAWSELGVTWNNLTDGGVQHASTYIDVGITDWFEWNLPPGLIHEWIDGITPNDGVVIKPVNPKKGEVVNFASREYGLPDLKPQLIVVYTPP